MKEFVVRLTRGQDLYKSIFDYCKENDIGAGVVASGVGCLYEAKIRNAGGKEIRSFNEPLEIVSLMGTVSKDRLHLHISLSKADLSTIGGHLVEGCLVNTTCELVIIELENFAFSKVFDETTGYNELLIKEIKKGE